MSEHTLKDGKKLRIKERIPDLWCPFCGQQIHKNGKWIDDNHIIDKNNLYIICSNNSVSGHVTIEAKADYHTTAPL